MNTEYFKKAIGCFVKANFLLAYGVYINLRNMSKKAIIIANLLLVWMICVCWLITYMSYKTRLTTAEWQRDSLKMKIDSVSDMHDRDVGYTKLLK